MKWGIANDEFDFSFMGIDEFLDAWVESSARFAGWVKKLDDRDFRAGRAENRRVHSNELAHRGVCRLILAKLALFIYESAHGESHDREDAGKDKKSSFFHF